MKYPQETPGGICAKYQQVSASFISKPNWSFSELVSRNEISGLFPYLGVCSSALNHKDVVLWDQYNIQPE